MANDFYKQWFSRPRTIEPPSPREQWRRYTERLRTLSMSQFGRDLAERFDIPEVEEAEKAFKEAIKQITDPEVRNAVDVAAGRISTAYQILGFCAGHFSQDSRSNMI